MPHRKKFRDSGRRRALAIYAATFAILGTSYVLDTTPARVAGFDWLPDLLGPQSVGLGWLVAALACAIVAIFRPRLPSWCEAVAFGLIIAPSVCAAVIFIAAWLQGFSLTGYISSAIYAAFAALALNSASWEEPFDDN